MCPLGHRYTVFANGAEIAAIVVVATIALAGLGAATGQDLLLFVAVIGGFVVVLPLVAAFGDRLVDDGGEVTPLDALRAQYASGEVSRGEVERLVATGDADPADVERMDEFGNHLDERG